MIHKIIGSDEQRRIRIIRRSKSIDQFGTIIFFIPLGTTKTQMAYEDLAEIAFGKSQSMDEGKEYHMNDVRIWFMGSKCCEI